MLSSPPKTLHLTCHRNLPIASSLIWKALSGREAIAASREDQLIALCPRSVSRKKTIRLAGWLRHLYREHLSIRGCEGVHRAARSITAECRSKRSFWHSCRKHGIALENLDLRG